ncbi:Uncharacterised protein [Yersinia enterocolitica]|nr:Uncharacterised protein [Yersinia enterocolitica]CRX49985.1 Uncharacterised protein [Yersinia enterocolitica]
MITLKIGEQFFTLNDGDVQYIAEAFQIALFFFPVLKI